MGAAVAALRVRPAHGHVSAASADRAMRWRMHGAIATRLAPSRVPRRGGASMNVVKAIYLSLVTGVVMIGSMVAPKAQGVPAQFSAPQLRRSGVDKIVAQWVQETTIDRVVWEKNPNDKSQAGVRVMQRLREAAERAARNLNQVACDGDPNLPAYAVQTYADNANVTPASVTSKIFTVACSGQF